MMDGLTGMKRNRRIEKDVIMNSKHYEGEKECLNYLMMMPLMS